jgi:hypothetical protein
LKWRPRGKNSSTWAFLCVNDESPIDVKVPHVMCCILCYSRLVGHVILEQKKKLKKGLVSYFKSNGIITLTNYVDANHGLIVKNFEEEMNNLKSPLERQLAKKRLIINVSAISNFLGYIDPYKKYNVHQKYFGKFWVFKFSKIMCPFNLLIIFC